MSRPGLVWSGEKEPQPGLTLSFLFMKQVFVLRVWVLRPRQEEALRSHCSPSLLLTWPKIQWRNLRPSSPSRMQSLRRRSLFRSTSIFNRHDQIRSSQYFFNFHRLRPTLEKPTGWQAAFFSVQTPPICRSSSSPPTYSWALQWWKQRWGFKFERVLKPILTGIELLPQPVCNCNNDDSLRDKSGWPIFLLKLVLLASSTTTVEV